MSSQELAMYLVSLITPIISMWDHWYKWHKEGRPRQAPWRVGLVLVFITGTWWLIYSNHKQHELDVEHLRKEAAAKEQAQAEKTQDLEARLMAIDQRDRLMPSLQRGLQENLHTDARIAVGVRRATLQTKEPPKP